MPARAAVMGNLEFLQWARLQVQIPLVGTWALTQVTAAVRPCRYTGACILAGRGWPEVYNNES